jgi:hypothetical protein
MMPVRARRVRATRRCAFLLAVLAAGAAPAAPKLQAVGAASVGYTDNFQTTPQAAQQGSNPRSAGPFAMISPGLVLALESPRMIQRLGYRYEYDLFLAQSNTTTSANQLDYQGLFDVSKRVALILGSSVSESNRYATVVFAAPGSGAVTSLPAGAGAFVQAEASETLSFDLGVGWRAWQGGRVLVESPILGTVAPQTSEFAARGGVEHSYLFDAVGAEVRSDYAVVHNGVLSNGNRAGVQEQLVNTAVGIWRHDLGRYFTSSAEAGAARIQLLNNGRGFWSPTASAMLAFADISGDAQLSYAHTISTNPLFGQSLLADEIRVRGGLPLTAHGELLVAGTLGYQNARLIDQNANLAARVHVIMGDITLGWLATRSLEVALRYQHVEQKSDATTPPLPLSFVQNNVLLGAVFKFPPDRDMPRPYRAPRRVDRSDEIREGVALPAGIQRPPGAPAR